LKASIFIFILAMLAAGSVVAQENGASRSRTLTAASDQSNAMIGEASSASEGRIGSIRLAERPALRRDDAKTNHSVTQSFNLEYAGRLRTERAIDERIIDRLGLFDRPHEGDSGRYSISLDLENEDSDWSFEVTVTTEF
jgi:hypothetical protein